MKRKWLNIAAVMAAAAAVGLMAGCGGGGAKSAASSAASAEKPAAKELRVACIATYPPFVYKAEDGSIVGFDVDITKAVAKEMGAATVYESMPFDQLVPALEGNKADIAVAAIDMTQDRADKTNFSKIYYNKESVAILARKDNSAIKGPEDLKGRTVAVEKGTLYEETAKQYGANVKTYDYHDKLLAAVAGKEADALILDMPVARYYLAHGADKDLKPAGIISGSGGFVMLLNKKDPDLQKNVNAALDKLMKSGEYDKIYEKWFAESNFEKEPAAKK